MEIYNIDIKTLLPQQPPFIMVDRLIQCEVMVTRTEFRVRADNLFLQDGIFLESGLIENIAQTCAARMGYFNTIVNPDQVKLGFIGSIKNLNIYRNLVVGELLETQINVQSEVFNIKLVNATVHVGNVLIAECEMKISE